MIHEALREDLALSTDWPEERLRRSD